MHLTCLAGVIEEPMCFLKLDGSLHCTLSRDTGIVGTPALDMKRILGINGDVTVRPGVVEEAVGHYQQILASGKEQLQAEYRTMFNLALSL